MQDGRYVKGILKDVVTVELLEGQWAV